ncbi:LacI family transcriptional regulator [Brevundimonas sp. SORGH_AS 993]|nr:LacI family transcriptional regulator [Brevundimonas sp. SORGH_AS_0993]
MATVTIYDVAAKAGVSIKSVSRVLNNEPNVSPALRAKVEAAASDLGYRRSLSARSLAGASSSLIAVLVDADLTIEHWKSGRGSDYLGRLEFGALMEARQADYHLMVELVDHNSPVLERDLMALLNSIRPEGVILTPPNSDNGKVMDVLEAANTPYARIGPEAAFERGFCIEMDERRASAEMTEHLIALGHRRIAFVTGPIAYGASRRRLAGYHDAMSAAGLPVQGGWIVQGDFTFGSGAAAANRLLDDSPEITAVFASNDDTALGVMQAATRRGVAIPDELSIAGFDDSPGAGFSTPDLTTIRQPVAEMAAAASQRLIPPLRRLLGEAASDRVIVAHDLIARHSTARPRLDNAVMIRSI